MPVVRMPDGTQVSFPDEMPADQIRSLIQQKFPDAAAQPAAPVTAALPAPADVPLPQPKPITDPVSRGLKIGTQAVGSGIAELVAMPADLAIGVGNLATAGINKATGTQIPPMAPSSDAIKHFVGQGADAIGFDRVPYEQMTDKEKLAYNVERYGSQAVGAIPALVRAAGGRAAQMATDAAPRWFDSLLRPYMGQNTGRTIAGDVAGAVGAGTGETVAERWFPDSSLAKFGGTVGGGLGAATGLSLAEALVRRAATMAGKPFGLNNANDVSARVNLGDPQALPVSNVVADRAATMVQDEAVNPEQASFWLRRNQTDLRSMDPNVPMPTSAALADDPGLARLETKMRATGDGAKFTERDRNFQSGVRDTLDNVAPENASPQPLIDTARREADMRTAAASAAEDNVRFDAATAQRAAEQEIARLEGRVAQLEGRGQRVQDIRYERGQELRDAGGREVPASQALDQAIVERGYIPARAEKNRLYNEGVPADTPVDLTGVRAAAGEVQGRVAQLPPSMRNAAADPALLDDAAQMERGTYNQARQTRMALSDDAAKARATGDFGRAENIDTLRRPLNEAIDTANPAAEANYRENFAPTYRPGPGDEAAKFTRQVDRDPTRSMTPPSQTAGRFLQPGQPEKHAALGRMIDAAENPLAGQTAAREYLLADMVSSGVVDQRTGLIRPDRLRTWQERWGNLDNVVPGFTGNVEQLQRDAIQGQRVSQRVATSIDQAGERVGEAQQRARATSQQFEDELRTAQKNSKATADEINKGALGLVTNLDPQSIVPSIMASPRKLQMLDDLLKTIGTDQQAKDGLKALFRDYITEAATNTGSATLKPGDSRNPVSFAKLTNMLKDKGVEQLLARVFDPDEMNTLRAGHKALDLAGIERLRAIRGGSDTAEKTGMIDQFLQTSVGKGVEAALRLKYGMLKGGGIISTARRYTSGMAGGPDLNEVMRVVERAAVDPELMGMLLGRKVPVASPTWNKRMQQLLWAGEAARESGPD